MSGGEDGVRVRTTTTKIIRSSVIRRETDHPDIEVFYYVNDMRQDVEKGLLVKRRGVEPSLCRKKRKWFLADNIISNSGP